MLISNVDIYKVADDKTLQAIVQFTVDNSIRITGVKLYINAQGNYVIKYPVNMGSKKQLAYIFPLSNEVRLEIENKIIEAYEALDQ